MFKPKQVKLDTKGLSRILGELETKVMEVVWQSSSCTVREMCQKLNCGKKLSFNTLMTIMNRLVEKRVLKKKLADGQYCYFPTLGRQQFLDTVTGSLVKSLIKDPAVFNLAAFVDTLGENPQKFNELKKLIDQKWSQIV